MLKFLPFVFLGSVASLFGITWIVWEVDPFRAPWYVFAGLVFLIFTAVFGLLGLLLYFLRTKFYKRYSVDWYIRTSFKMAFFVALFVALVFTLAFLKLISFFNLVLSILAVCLLAVWSFLGKKG